jgi:flagellar motility protein MotE (MotC chaperone)
MCAKLYTIFDKIVLDGEEDRLNTVDSVLVEKVYASSSSSLREVATSKSSETNSKDIVKNLEPDTKKNSHDKTSISQNTKPAGLDILQNQNLSSAELKLLQELGARRSRLDRSEDELRIKEKVLLSTEAKISQKIEELKLLQGKLEEVMKQYDQKEQDKIHSLVKIYENMKPREAAKILDELDMAILLRVIGNMKEVKAAPIIANMNSVKARDLSVQLAEQKSITEENNSK